jgi:hypothetical protein
MSAELVEEDEFVKHVSVVAGVGFFSSFLADDDGFEAFLLCARRDFKRRMAEPNTPIRIFSGS